MKIPIQKAELELKMEAELGEGAIWHPEEKVLYWVDIVQGILHRYNPLERKNQSFTMNSMIGTVVPHKTGGVVVALENGISHFDQASKFISLANFPEPKEANTRFNDGKCDPSGRFWVGTMHKKAKVKAGTLYCFDGNKLTPKIEGVSISNGLAWSVDHNKMYYIDTAENSIYTFAYDKKAGSMHKLPDTIQIPHYLGDPDGMTIDSEGMLWVAHWGGYAVIRWNPDTGEIMHKIQVDAPHVTSCAFGGNDLSTLFITTAREGLDEDMKNKFPDSGSLFSCKTEVKGLPAFKFVSVANE